MESKKEFRWNPAIPRACGFSIDVEVFFGEATAKEYLYESIRRFPDEVKENLWKRYIQIVVREANRMCRGFVRRIIGQYGGVDVTWGAGLVPGDNDKISVYCDDGSLHELDGKRSFRGRDLFGVLKEEAEDFQRELDSTDFGLLAYDEMADDFEAAQKKHLTK